jgi:hypothetical protein
MIDPSTFCLPPCEAEFRFRIPKISLRFLILRQMTSLQHASR